MNEFYDHSDRIGFLSSEPEPFSFLSTTNIQVGSFLENTNITRAAWNIKLGSKKEIIRRQVYTIMTLIGDIGGF